MNGHHAFTIRYPADVNSLRTRVHVCSVSVALAHSHDHEFVGLWDTGAERSVITNRVVRTLGLQPVGKCVISGVHGFQECQVYFADIVLPNNVRMGVLEVTECAMSGGFDVLIGMDVIGLGNLAITRDDNGTVMSFVYPHHDCVDYVQVIEKVMQSDDNHPPSELQ